MSKVCAIVGAGAGVGLSVAKRFAAEGFDLALLKRDVTSLQAEIAELEAGGTSVRAYPLDVAELGSIPQVFERIVAEMGQPQVMVYNTGVMKPQQPSELSAEAFMADFTVNTIAGLMCAQQVIPAMRKAKQGTILFTGGGLALYPQPQYAALSVAKAGLRSLCYCLAAELQPDNIRVGTVTIAGMVQPDTHFDPDLIAEKYWLLHTQSVTDDVETIYQ